jgi:3-hydroxyacyl-CoA dehydrogenase
MADRICERGWFGQKTGRGFYLYPEGARVGQPDPEVLAIVDAERAKKGVTPRSFTADEHHAPLHGRHGQRRRQGGGTKALPCARWMWT